MNRKEKNRFKNEESFNNNKRKFESYNNEKASEEFNYNDNNYDEENDYSMQYNTENTSYNYDGDFDEENKRREKERRKILDKPLKVFGGICIAVTIAAFVFTSTTSVNTSAAAKDALANKISTVTKAGTILLSKDENLEAKDYTVSHNSNTEETKIWVWDYAAEDGDYVQVLVNENPVGDAFMIKHKPKELTVPATGTVQVKGIRDGGGGITYAVRYDLNGTTYFNSAPEGKANTYTLVKE